MSLGGLPINLQAAVSGHTFFACSWCPAKLGLSKTTLFIVEVILSSSDLNRLELLPYNRLNALTIDSALSLFNSGPALILQSVLEAQRVTLDACHTHGIRSRPCSRRAACRCPKAASQPFSHIYRIWRKDSLLSSSDLQSVFGGS